jgi:hypothetical protein
MSRRVWSVDTLNVVHESEFRTTFAGVGVCELDLQRAACCWTAMRTSSAARTRT